MDKIKIHLVAAPHMNVKWNDRHMATCAYSTKIYLISKILSEMGHHVVHYGVEGNDVLCEEQVNYISKDVWDESHGQRSDKDYHDFGDHLLSYQVGSKSIAEEVNSRLTDPQTEVVLTTFGLWTPNLQNINSNVIEWGIGYDWSWAKYKVFESYAWQHIQYRGLGENYDISGTKHFDAVIPGYVDKNQFTYKENKDNYILFLGRIMNTKGIHIAVELAKHYKTKLVVAGNGDTDVITKDASKFIEYVGVVNNDEKRELYANAKATMCLTQYVEPFGNVHIESLMSGTPVISTDWGVYTETVPNGLVGYRGRVWSDYCFAMENITKIDPKVCRKRAESNFSLEAVYPKFNTYFNKVASFNSDSDPFYNVEVPEYSQRFTDYHLTYLRSQYELTT